MTLSCQVCVCVCVWMFGGEPATMCYTRRWSYRNMSDNIPHSKELCFSTYSKSYRHHMSFLNLPIVVRSAPLKKGAVASDLLSSSRTHYHVFWNLREHFREEQSQLFVLTSKAHSLLHVCIGSGDTLNPRHSWCFQAEDFMGKMRVLAHSCTRGAKDLTTSRTMVNKYLVALQWTLHHPDSWFWRFN